jgi:glucosamine kinase
MILIADSGSTKTHWKLIKPDNITESHYTKGLNPYFAGEETFRKVLEDDLPVIKKEIHCLYFYGSGCASEQNILLVREHLEKYFVNAQVFVYGDLFGAARALLGKDRGIACILGTGSVSCVYDGDKITDAVPSLGFILGDDAGGVTLGKELLRAYFYRKFPPDVLAAFEENFPVTRDELLTKVYHSPSPNAYLAKYAAFLKKNYTHPFLHDLVSRCFRSFFTDHIIVYHDHQNLPLVFTGSVSSNLKDVLNEVAGEFGLTIHKIMKEPMEGLVDYHSRELELPLK